MRKRLIYAAVFVFLCSLGSLFAEENKDLQQFDLTAASGFTTITAEEIDAAISAKSSDARLFYTPERIALAQQKIADDPVWGTFYAALEHNADSLLNEGPLERVQEGVRILEVAREALRRIFTLTFCAAVHPEKTEYADRAIVEMRTIAQFSDWNPRHFLDVAELTTAMAIGYDALRSQMSEEDRNLIADAILKKGLLAGTEKNHLWWMTNSANWNQVCHTGLMLGALVLIDREPELAKKIICRSVNGITYSMASYEPDGNYTEGPGYWSYGTSFNILFLTALNNTLGTDFGRSSNPGFSNTIHYFEQVFGPTGDSWNYPDSGLGPIFEPTVFYFAEKLNDKDLTYNEYRLFTNRFNQNPPEKRMSAFGAFAKERLAPMAFLFDTGPVQNPPISPKEKGFVGIGNGESQIAVFRTGWEPDSAWLGIKGGSPSGPHGHMDAGSFVYERYGYRWASDLGPEDYYKIESRKMSLWSMKQDSDRWNIYRYNNFSHNTITVNGEKMRADATAAIEESFIGQSGEDSYAVIDLTPVYAGSVQKAVRKGTLHSDGTMEIVDTVTAPADKNASVVWRFLTRAQPEIRSDGTVLLSMGRGDKQAAIELIPHLGESEQPIQWNSSDANGKNEWDSPNKGTTELNFTIEVPAGQTAAITVDFR